MNASVTLPNGVKTTPAMEQYFRIKQEHPDCLLFFRMGDFYELFFEDAVTASAALNITLTRRGKQDGQEIPMCGVPYHAADAYLARLIRQDFRVAICDQMESPEEAKKRGSKSVVRRDVTRIVTPGTLTEESLLVPEANSYLAALATVNAQWALAWLDLSTGVFRVKRVDQVEIEETLSRLNPKEVLVADSQIEALDLPDWQALLVPQPQARFDSVQGEQRLLATYKLGALDSFGDLSRAEIGAAGAILAYVELTQKLERFDLRPLAQEQDGGIMGIDAATRRNLELTLGPENSRKGSLLACIDKTVTAGGARELTARLAAPLTEVSGIQRRLDQVAVFVDDPDFSSDLRSILKSAPDLDRSVQRLLLNRGGPRDLQAVKVALDVADQLKALVSQDANEDSKPTLESMVSGLQHLGESHSRLAEALQEQVPLLARDGSFIVKGYHAALDELLTLRDEGRRLIANLQAQYEAETKVKGLKIKHNKVLGYFIEVRAQDADKIPCGAEDPFIHRQTMANMVRFTTADLAELQQKITNAGDQALALELELFEELRAMVLKEQDELMQVAASLATLDVSAGLAVVALDRDWCRPDVSNKKHFELVGARHPVVEEALKRDAQAFVANDCSLSDTDRLWLLTGPNMAGKSTFLRQNALISILAQMGAYVPATSARIGLVDRVFSRVGAADDLARGRSTFMVEMVETAMILRQATDQSLVILDEIGRGTATYDGLSIAWATVEHLHEVNRCRTLFATHYHELTELEQSLEALSCHAMQVKEWQDEVVFLHEVGKGAANRSYGIHVAKLAGLPEAVVARSQSILETLEASSNNGNDGEQSTKASLGNVLDDLPLFTAEVATHSKVSTLKQPEALAKLAEIDPDVLTPRDALELMYELKALSQVKPT